MVSPTPTFAAPLSFPVLASRTLLTPSLPWPCGSATTSVSLKTEHIWSTDGADRTRRHGPSHHQTWFWVLQPDGSNQPPCFACHLGICLRCRHPPLRRRAHVRLWRS